MRSFGPVSSPLLLSLAAALAFGCGPSPERGPFEPDCDVEDAYDFKLVPQWYDLRLQNNAPAPPGARLCNDGEPNNFFCSPDATPPVAMNGAGFGADHGMETLEEPRCGSTVAHTMRFYDIRDWGAVIGTYAQRGPMGQNPMPTDVFYDETYAIDPAGPDDEVPYEGVPYEGLSFWARQDGDPGFVLLLNDKTTQVNTIRVDNDSGTFPDMCTIILGPDQLNDGGIPEKGSCGNTFETTVMPTRHWQFFTIPLSNFTQQLWPNRIPTGIDPASIHTFVIRAPKDSHSELWLDRFAWYRKRPTTN